MSLDVLPVTPLPDVIDGPNSDAITFSEYVHGFVRRPDGANGVFGQDGAGVLTTNQLSPLGNLVHHVVGSRAEEQVVGPHTAPVVAPMEDARIVSNRAVSQLIGDAMSEKGPSLTAFVDLSVPGGVE